MEGAITTVSEEQLVVQLVDASSFRTHLHRRALGALESFQADIDGFLEDLLGGVSVQPVHYPDPEGHGLPMHFNQHEGGHAGDSGALVLAEGDITTAVFHAAQQKASIVKRTYVTMADLQRDIADLLTTLDTDTGGAAGMAMHGRRWSDGEYAKVTEGIEGDIMKEAAATSAAAERFQMQANELSQLAASLQQQAWKKVCAIGHHTCMGVAICRKDEHNTTILNKLPCSVHQTVFSTFNLVTL